MKSSLHIHHIIPRHMGGTDDPENLTPPISIELHAAFHKQLWEDFGFTEDFIAWRALSGRMTSEEARLAAAKAGQERSIKYQETRKQTGVIVKAAATFESRSKGGKTASKALVAWQKKNKESFAERCADTAKRFSHLKEIPHEYSGKTYKSKKELQKENNMCNSTFYKKLKLGQIIRLQREVDRYDSNV